MKGTTRSFLPLVFLSAAAFSPSAYTTPPPTVTVGPPLTVTVEGPGTIISSPGGIDCPPQCDVNFPVGTSVELTAVPESDATFTGWDGLCAEQLGFTCVLTVKGRMTISGLFEMLPVVDYPAPVPASGATICYDTSGAEIDCAGTGQDGEFEVGVPWPLPRFTDNGDGTLTDELTGIIWAKMSLCRGSANTWDEVAEFVASMEDGLCKLTDGSVPGDWRLPTAFEALSLVDFGTGKTPECVFDWPNGLPNCAPLTWTNTPSSSVDFYVVDFGSYAGLMPRRRTLNYSYLAVKRQ